MYSYHAERYNPNIERQTCVLGTINLPNANFLTEDLYLGNITDPVTSNRYNYVKSSPLNYIDSNGHEPYFNYVTGEYEDRYYEDILGNEIERMGDFYDLWLSRYLEASDEQRQELIGGEMIMALTKAKVIYIILGGMHCISIYYHRFPIL